MTNSNHAKFACFGCGRLFQMGPNRYDGQHIASYKISVCSGCWSSNWDGWAPFIEKKLLIHLAAEGIPVPERNEKGWLPRS